MNRPTPKLYRHVAIFMDQDGHIVGGYCPGAYYPEGTFPTAHAALDHALSLLVADLAQPPTSCGLR